MADDPTPHPPSPEGKGEQAVLPPLPLGEGPGEGSYGFSSHPRLSSLLSGALPGLAFPPFPCGFLAWVGLIPLLCLIDGGCARKAFKRGYLSGLAFNLVALYWIAWLTPMGAVAAVLYLPVFVGLFAAVMTRLVRRLGRAALWGAPVVWTAIEYVRSQGQLGFPWALIGNTQARYLPLIQYAEWTGVYGVTFWVVAVNVAVLRIAVQSSRFKVQGSKFKVGSLNLERLAFFALFVVPLAYGLWRIPAGPSAGKMSVGIVQPNRSPEAVWEPDGTPRAYETLFRMTGEVASKGARLVVWPETAAPTYLRTDARYRPAVQALADSLNVAILTGAPDHDAETGVTTNAAFLFRPGRRDLQRYDKMHLVPFGEAMPYGDVFPVLRKVTFSASGFSSGDFTRGRRMTVFDGPEGRFGTLICFESVFPELARGMAALGADFLVVITNDAWFGATSSPHQHAEITVFRAVENRIAVARCATTGVSAVFDPFGRSVERTGIFHPATLTAALPLRTGETFYTRYGDLFAQACVVISAMGLLLKSRKSGK